MSSPDAEFSEIVCECGDWANDHDDEGHGRCRVCLGRQGHGQPFDCLNFRPASIERRNTDLRYLYELPKRPRDAGLVGPGHIPGCDQ